MKKISAVRKLFLIVIIISLIAVEISLAAPVQDNALGTYVDDFSDVTGLSARTNTNVNAGALSLTNSGGGFVAPFNTSGTATTTTIQPLRLSNWGTVTINSTTPAGTSIKIQVTDEGNNLYSDAILPGNTAGFTDPTIDLSSLPVDRNAGTGGDHKIGRIRFRITFTTTDTSVTPTIDSLSFNWTLFTGDVTVSLLADTEWPLSDSQDTTGKKQISATFLNGGYPIVRYAASSGAATLQSVVRGAGEELYIMTQGAADYSVPVFLRSLNKDTGVTNWTRYINGNFYSYTPMALTANGTIYTSDIFSDVLMAHDATTGAVKWMYAFGGGHTNGHASVGPDGKIYTERYGDNNLTVYAFNPDGSIAWTSNPIPLTSYVNMNNDISFGLDGKLYVAVSVKVGQNDTTRTGEGKLYALNPTDGTTAWSYATGDVGGNITPIVNSAGTIFVANEGPTSLNKSMYAINPDGTLLWRRDIGTSTDYWNTLALRPDGVLVADRVNTTYPTLGGLIEFIDSTNGNVLNTVVQNFQNTIFPPVLIADQGNNTISTNAVYQATTNISQYDSVGVQKWAYAVNDGHYIRFVGWNGGTIADESGNIYTSYTDSTSNITKLVALTPWTVTPTYPTISDTLYPGSVIDFNITSTMPATNPLTGVANVMQIIMDDDSTVPLIYQSTDSNGDTIWARAVTLPSNTSVGTHSFSIESSASGMTTDVTTHFTSPATGSNNTGLVSTGSYVVSSSNPVPTLTSISPTSATAGGAQFTLTTVGTNFTSDSVVKWNGTSLTTTYVSSTELTATVPAVNIATAGTSSVTVFNGAPGGGTSSAQTFTITAASGGGSGGGGGSAKKKTTPVQTVCSTGQLFSPATGLPCTSFTTSPSIVSGPTKPSLNSGPSGCFIILTLRQGSRGDQVKCLQTKLNILSDGIFGPITKTAVLAFQKEKGLVVDGIFGPKTKALLFSSPVISSMIITPTPKPKVRSGTVHIQRYNVNYTAGTNGSLTGSTEQVVDRGADGTTVTAVPDAGYVFGSWSDGVLTASRTDTNVFDDITVTANFLATIVTPAIAGVTAPATGATPVSTIADTTEYTATISWSPTDATFLTNTVYTASITITPKTGYTLTGVLADFFTVAGATATNSIDSGVVTAVFPITFLSIGDSYGGGVVAYVLQSGDPGYDAGTQHGLIAAPVDQSTSALWYESNTSVTNAIATALGTGLANTDTAISIQGTGDFAPNLARAYTGGGFDDWYLPSKDELHKLYLNKVAVGGFADRYYWSSSEQPEPNHANIWVEYFGNGYQTADQKIYTDHNTRAIRSF